MTRPFTEVVDEFLSLFEPRQTMPEEQIRARMQELIAQMGEAQSAGVWVRPAKAEETPELPPLPGPAYGWFSDYYDGWSYTENPTDRWQDMLLFTEEQVSAYGRECWDAGRRAGLEEAAKLVDTTELQEARRQKLVDLMGRISEEHYCAGWMNGLEYTLWEMVTDPAATRRYGMEVVSEEAIAQLRDLSAKVDGWWRWVDDESEPGLHVDQWGERFTPLAEWEVLFARHMEADRAAAGGGECGGTGRAKP